MKILFKVLFVILAVVLILLAVLPYSLSLGPVRRVVLGAVNAGMQGHLSMDYISIGWVRGMSLRGLEYRDEDAGISAGIEEVSVDSGLLRMLGRTCDLGTAVIRKPDVSIRLPEKIDAQEGTTPRKIAGQERSTRPAPQKRARAERTRRPKRENGGVALPFFRDVRLKMHVSDGRIGIAEGDRDGVAFSAINGEIEVPSLYEKVRFDVTATQIPGEGDIRIKGEGHFKGSRTLDPDSLRADFVCACRSIDLKPLSCVVSTMGGPTETEGLLRFTSSNVLSGVGQLYTEGALLLSGLGLSGGPLGQDRLRMDSVGIDFDLTAGSDRIEITKLALNSPIATFSMSGELMPRADQVIPGGSLSGKMEVNIPELANQLPNTLRLRQGLFFEKGRLEATIAVEAGADGLTVVSQGGLRDVLARHEGTALSLESPVEWTGRGKWGGRVFSIDSLELTAPFGVFTGEGNPESMMLGGRMDLARVIAEARKFVDLEKFGMAGTLKTTALMRKRDSGDYGLSAKLDLRDLILTGITPAPLRQNAANLDLNTGVYFDPESGARGLTDLRITGRCDTVSFRAGAVGIRQDVPGRSPSVKGLHIETSGAMEDILEVCRRAGLMRSSALKGGEATVAIDADIADDLLSVSAARASLKDVSVVGEKAQFSDPSMEVLARGSVALDGSRIAVDDFRVVSTPITLRGSGRFEQLADAIEMDLDMKMVPDLPRVSEMLTAMTGQNIAMEGGETNAIAFHARVKKPEFAEILREAEAEGEVSARKIHAMGLAATDVALHADLHNGTGRFLAQGGVNGGKLSFESVMAQGETGPEWFIREPQNVIQGARLTDDMASHALARIHPVFYGSTVVSGMVNMAIQQLRVPITSDAAKKLESRGALSFEGVVLRSSGLIQELLDLLKLPSVTVGVPDQEIGFSCSNGWIESEELTLKAGDYALVLHGKVGVDGTVRYMADVPVTEHMVDKKVYKYLRNTRLRVLIQGTVSKPKIARESFATTLKGLVTEAARNAITEEGAKLLERILR